MLCEVLKFINEEHKTMQAVIVSWCFVALCIAAVVFFITLAFQVAFNFREILELIRLTLRS